MTRKQFLFSAIGLAVGPHCLRALESPSPLQPLRDLESRARSLDPADKSSIAVLASTVLDCPHSFEIPSAIKLACMPRLVKAEQSCRQSPVLAVHENSIVSLLNDTATALNAPTFAQVTPHQIRVIRMNLLKINPVFMGYGITRADAKPGDSISPYMSPLQALHLALSTADQKLLNENYQFEPAEWETQYRIRQAERAQALVAGADGPTPNAPHSVRLGLRIAANEKHAELSQRVNESLSRMTMKSVIDLATNAMARLGF